jgi:tRNA A-37 threonylcarbamoyl transferase component Bud32
MDSITTLKGGSLNSTCLHVVDQNKFVRKSIRTDADREYGYVRWYSQLKKLQRFNQMFPGLVPKVYDVGVTEYGAHFDIEYIDAVDIKTLFRTNQLTDAQVSDIHDKIWQGFDTIHATQYRPNSSSLLLYFKEEVEQKLTDARKFVEFDNFYDLDQYEFCGHRVQGVKQLFKQFQKLFDQTIDQESYVHGNPTLENILYSTDTRQLVFIDLYEEGIVDSKYVDYSQILQCSNSLYGIINDTEKTIKGDYINVNILVPSSLTKFDQLFNDELKNRCNNQQYNLIKLFEATQFFRMLPFKCHGGDIAGAKFFYVHACKLIGELL